MTLSAYAMQMYIMHLCISPLILIDMDQVSQRCFLWYRTLFAAAGCELIWKFLCKCMTFFFVAILYMYLHKYVMLCDNAATTILTNALGHKYNTISTEPDPVKYIRMLCL